MNDNERPLDKRLLIKAASHLRMAIELLDLSGAAGHIAAHADLSLSELDHLIARTSKWPAARRDTVEQHYPDLAGSVDGD